MKKMKKLDADKKLKVVLGQFIRVENEERKSGVFRYSRGCAYYIALQVEDLDGNGERCILFTPTEHTNMKFITLPDLLLNKMVKGRIYPVNIARRDCFIIRTVNWDGKERIIRISESQLKTADQRAHKHPASLTKKDVLTDLFD